MRPLVPYLTGGSYVIPFSVDNKTTAKKIYEVEELDDFEGDRLAEGK